MFNWEDLRYFLAVAQTGTVSGAARSLNVDHTTVGRRLTALEAALQVRLVDRLPRRWTLTDTGRCVLQLGAEMEANAFSIERATRAEHSPVVGKVTVSAPPVLVSNFFAKSVVTFRAQHPGIQLSLSGRANSVSLSRREADIAVRLFRPEEEGSVARRLGIMQFALYAAESYAHICRSSDWEFIAYDEEFDHTPQQQWLRKMAGNRPIVCEVSDITSQYAAVRAGVGIAVLPCFLAEPDGQLVRLHVDVEPFSREIWLVVHRDLRRAQPIRAVMDFITELVENTPSLQTAIPLSRVDDPI